MKTKMLILLLTGILVCSCYESAPEADDICMPEEYTPFVKSKEFYKPKSIEPEYIWRFETNQDGLITKRTEIFVNLKDSIDYYYFYYHNKKIKSKSHYNRNAAIGWLRFDSTEYIYDGDKINEELIYYYWIDTKKYSYEYDGNTLVQKTSTDNIVFPPIITYNYQNRCLKSEYYRSKDYQISSYIVYYFSSKKITKKEFYTYDHRLKYTITFEYDLLGRLVYERSRKDPDYKTGEAPTYDAKFIY